MAGNEATARAVQQPLVELFDGDTAGRRRGAIVPYHEREGSGDVNRHALRTILKSQLHASLAMLRATIVACPDDLWSDASHANACWNLAYHTLYFTHLYLQRDEASFVPWEQHQAAVQHPDGIAGPRDEGSEMPLLPEPYDKEQVLAYWTFCDGIVDDAVDAMDLTRPDSGFPWYRMSKLEHQLVNIRHVQHHTAQIADRLRARCDVGTQWVGASKDIGSADE